MTKRRARGEGSVCWKESKQAWVWRAVVGYHSDGRVKYTEGRARSQTEALQKKRLAERTNRKPDANKISVGDYLNRWLDETKSNVQPGTWTSYERVVRLHLNPHIGGIPLASFTAPDCNRLYAKLSRNGVTAGNIRKVSDVLASAMEVAVQEGSIPGSPTRGARKPKLSRPAIEVFSDEEIIAILDATNGHRFEALIATAIGSGAREGKLFALDVTDIDLKTGIVHIHKSLDQSVTPFRIKVTKSKRGDRHLKLPAFAIEALERVIGDRKSGTVFTDTDGGFLRKSNFIRRDWKNILELAKVPKRKFHNLRHTHASRLLADGRDPAEVAKRIGDGVDTLLRVYSHWMPANQKTAERAR